MLKLLVRKLRAGYARATRQRVFRDIYRRNLWSGGESVSGGGSSLQATAHVREALPGLLRQLGVRTMLDAPCGDFYWMSQVELPLDHYVGIDIVPDLVENNHRRYGSPTRSFLVLDAIKDDLPHTDLVLCRHLLIHLPLRDCRRVLRNFQRSGAKYLLVTQQPQVSVNREIHTGSFRPLNLMLPPFDFPRPVQTFTDATAVGDPAVLALYDFQTLQLG
ncbi:MAG TPA: class I SAM-dependent methyltransferase [Terriglobales bacterium]|nr:class I SAM-dependent methyltransferase [Terriglobales bacterium]